MSCEDRKGLILEAADRLLRRLGPARTTVADIAREAQVGVGSVYLEFSSKDAIITELSAARHGGVLGAMRVAAASDGGVRRRVEAIFEARARAFLALRQEGDHAPELVHCVAPAVKAAHERFRGEERRLLCEVLAAARQAGELGPFDPEEAASTLLRCYASFSPPWLYHEPEESLRAALAAMHRLVLDGLLARPCQDCLSFFFRDERPAKTPRKAIPLTIPNSTALWWREASRVSRAPPLSPRPTGGRAKGPALEEVLVVGLGLGGSGGGWPPPQSMSARAGEVRARARRAAVEPSKVDSARRGVRVDMTPEENGGPGPRQRSGARFIKDPRARRAMRRPRGFVNAMTGLSGGRGGGGILLEGAG